MLAFGDITFLITQVVYCVISDYLHVLFPRVTKIFYRYWRNCHWNSPVYLISMFSTRNAHLSLFLSSLTSSTSLLPLVGQPKIGTQCLYTGLALWVPYVGRLSNGYRRLYTGLKIIMFFVSFVSCPHSSTPLWIYLRIDYCNTVLAGAPRIYSNGQVTSCVERCCACHDRHLEVWPRPGSDTAWRTSLARRPPTRCFSSWCLNGRAPPYLLDYCVPAAGVDTQQHLRSANRQLFAVPRYRLNTYGHRAFLVPSCGRWECRRHRCRLIFSCI